ncbi:MAG: hypothetical protein WCG95_09690 [bacterium]
MITAINSSINFQGGRDYQRKYLSEPAKSLVKNLLGKMAPVITVDDKGLTFSGTFLTRLKGKSGQEFAQPLSSVSMGGTISGKYPPFQVTVDETCRITNVKQPSLFGLKLMSREQVLKRATNVLEYFYVNFNNPAKVQKNTFCLQGLTSKGWARFEKGK